MGEMEKDSLEVEILGAGGCEFIVQVLLCHRVQDLDCSRVIDLGEVDGKVHDFQHAVVVVGDIVLFGMVVISCLDVVLGGEGELFVVFVELGDLLVGLGSISHLVILYVALDGLFDVFDAL